MNSENKRLHLQLIQNIIGRMGGNSFLLRGWSITIVIAVMTLAVSTDGVSVDQKLEKTTLVLIAILLTIIFWILDAYYLSKERQYRDLYSAVALKDETEIDFSLNASPYDHNNCTWFASLWSPVFLMFYGVTLILLLVVSNKFIGVNFFLR